MAEQETDGRFASQLRCLLPVLADARHIDVGNEIVRVGASENQHASRRVSLGFSGRAAHGALGARGALGYLEYSVRAQPLINCRDVQTSSRWYQRLLSCVGGHGGTEYERLWDPKLHTSKWGSDGLILQLHAWEVDHHHGPMGDPSRAVGNGMLLWFEVDDFDAAVARACDLEAPILLDVHRNPNANHRELWIRDPDGYTVVLASRDGEAKEA